MLNCSCWGMLKEPLQKNTPTKEHIGISYSYVTLYFKKATHMHLKEWTL